jgi:ATP-dependent Lhr-like helicase
MSLSLFHPLVSGWFREKFGAPTEAQRLGWPSILNRSHTLIAAPTGSGKTLAAFLACLDQLVRQGIAGGLSDQTQVVYISPLKALSNDIRRNLEIPLLEISDLAAKEGIPLPEIRVQVRTGDTPPSERRLMIRRPPHILVTTPESFYLLLTAESGRKILSSVETVIIDEIHAVTRDKRGSHLALSLERLEALCKKPPLRIGLSATQKPVEEIARFLVGSRRIDREGKPDCTVIDIGHSRQMDLAIECPVSPLSAVCSLEQWKEVYTRIAELIRQHRSTLIFVNTRRLAERVTFYLTEILGEQAVASHHGSLSKEIRFNIETRLKEGNLKAVVATASLELGIDIGFIDLVSQIGSPRSIATFLQRIGRSGHSLGVVPKGRLIALTRDELVECAALIRAVKGGRLDQIEIPVAPLDILAQQIVAAAACEEWEEDKLFYLFQGAYPYRNLKREDYDDLRHLLSEGLTPFVRAGSYLYRDRVHQRIKGKRGARLAALTSGGAIPELADFRVITEPERVTVGTVDEDFAIESLPGDVFLLGNTSWRILHVRGGEVAVADSHGAAPTIPFWRGEAPGRTPELSMEVSQLRNDLEKRLDEPEKASQWITETCHVPETKAREMVHYFKSQREATGLIPTQNHLFIERFFDESGGMQLVIHAPFGSRINRAFGLALRKRFCRRFDFELQASADDNGILLSVGRRQSFSIEDIRGMISSVAAKELLIQALLASPAFTVRWRWNVTRSLAVLRYKVGKKVPPALQRFKADDLLTAVFPAITACPENASFVGNIPVPDHLLVRQTVEDTLHEALDVEGWIDILKKIEQGGIRITEMDTREPSPFSYQILNGNPYTFLDGAPLEERRARAVSTRRTLSTEDLKELGKLDPDAVLQIQKEAWPEARDADELHETLLLLAILPHKEGDEWKNLLEILIESGRGTRVIDSTGRMFWTAAERWTLLQAAYPGIKMDPDIPIPSSLLKPLELHEAVNYIVKGRMEVTGPTTSLILSQKLGLPLQQVEEALLVLEREGILLRGNFTPHPPETREIEWCHRNLLARIHRLTLDKLRRQIKPIDPEEFMMFALRWNHLHPETHLEGPQGLQAILSQLQGFEIPARLWESEILPARMVKYNPQWLDALCHSGDLLWGRTRVGSHREANKTLPLSLMRYGDLEWIRAGEENQELDFNTEKVFNILRQKGALFFRELVSEAHLLPAEVEVSLWKLVASGLVSGDGFEAVRHLTIPRWKQNAYDRFRRNHSSKNQRRRLGNGRWWAIRNFTELQSNEKGSVHSSFEPWCRQLLERYGILFRDLMARESAAPPWYRLLPVLRTLELKGEIRGGRFISGVSGEQYGLPEAVETLRSLREHFRKNEIALVNAADPVNLAGIVGPGSRLKAIAANALVYLGGKYVGHRQGKTIWLDPSLKPEFHQMAERLLKTGRIPPLIN